MDNDSGDAELTVAVAELTGVREGERIAITPIHGGRNNRVYKVEGVGDPLLLKRYYSEGSDSRDRFAAERGFYGVIESAGVTEAPQAIGWDSARRLGLLSFIVGRKLEDAEVDAEAIDRALAFVSRLNRDRRSPAALALGDASEACFSIVRHLDVVDGRVRRMSDIAGSGEDTERAKAFVASRLMPIWKSICEEIDGRAREQRLRPERELTTDERCISPSDLGFHNAIRREDGMLAFFDFEYAGWDDPAKLICDFFCQQQKPVPLTHWDRVVASMSSSVGENSDYARRAALLLPVYQVKWCCIILNDFLAADSARRSFAEGASPAGGKKARQLAAAEMLHDTIAARRS